MKASWEDDYEMPAEIDFSKMKQVPNPFAQRFRDLHLVALDNDIAEAFPDSDAVNEALRAVMNTKKESEPAAKEFAKAG